MIEAGQAPKTSKAVILGLTFKENCPDTRKSNVDDIIKRLNDYSIDPIVVDLWTDPEVALREYRVILSPMEEIADVDCKIIAMAHDEFKNISTNELFKHYSDGKNRPKF